MMGVRDTRRTRQVLVVLLAVALALIAFGYADGSSPALRGVRHVSGAVFGGAEHAASSVAGFFGGSGGSSGQVRQLQAQVAQLRAELSQAQLSKSDYAQLRKLLALAGEDVQGAVGQRPPAAVPPAQPLRFEDGGHAMFSSPSVADRKVVSMRASMLSSSSPVRRALASQRCSSRRSGAIVAGEPSPSVRVTNVPSPGLAATRPSYSSSR